MTPYFRFDDGFQIDIVAYDIKYNDSEKRIRVFSIQILDTIIDNLTLSNSDWSNKIFFGFGMKLRDKYPDKGVAVEKALSKFTHKFQEKIEKLKVI